MPTHPRDGRTLLDHLWGGHTNTTTTTFRVADTVFDCGSGGVRWCARHPQHLGSPWGIGGSAPTPQGWQDTAWSPWGGQTHTTTITFGVADTVFDCGSGVVRWCARHPQHLGSPWGIGGNAPTPQGWQDSAWLPLGATHTPPRPHSALPTPYSTVRIAVRVSYGGVHVILSI